MGINFDVHILPQPTDVTCGPTCLSCVYQYLDFENDLDEVVKSIPQLPGGGTLGAHLGIDALSKGFDVSIFTHNLQVFDPTWFSLSKGTLIEKLQAQCKTKKLLKTREASRAYVDFLKIGGDVKWQELTGEFVFDLLKSGPVIVGLSATYLYWTKREFGLDCVYDDINGEPQGHFVVICGVSSDLARVSIADPHRNNPIGNGLRYTVKMRQLINATLIGAITYDANFIQIRKKS